MKQLLPLLLAILCLTTTASAQKRKNKQEAEEPPKIQLTETYDTLSGNEVAYSMVYENVKVLSGKLVNGRSPSAKQMP